MLATKPVILVGMMGCGKSTVASIVAKKLGYEFLDIDEIIVKNVGCSIVEIFKYQDEEYFRKKEYEALTFALEKNNVIIASGGGAYINDKSRKLIEEKSISIWLNATCEVIYRRVKYKKTRPLIANTTDVKKSVYNLYEKRRPIYQQAKIHVDTSNLNQFQAADIIIEKILQINENT